MADEQQSEEVQRWTPKRRAAELGRRRQHVCDACDHLGIGRYFDQPCTHEPHTTVGTQRVSPRGPLLGSSGYMATGDHSSDSKRHELTTAQGKSVKLFERDTIQLR